MVHVVHVSCVCIYIMILRNNFDELLPEVINNNFFLMLTLDGQGDSP